MNTFLSFCFGYLVGCIHPAAMLSKHKHVDLKQEGTKNMGATNTAIVLGRGSGIFVMIVDILKSLLASRVARRMFPQLVVAGMIASLGTIVGHCFPVFLRFHGGKGLAAFGGMVLGYNPWIFLTVLIPGVILILLLNTGVALPIFACFAFPLLTWLWHGSWQEILCAVLAGGFLFAMHWTNLRKALQNRDVISTDHFLKDILFKKKDRT